MVVNQRKKLTRVMRKTALKNFHPRLYKIRYFVGELWSVRNGYYAIILKASFAVYKDVKEKAEPEI